MFKRLLSHILIALAVFCLTTTFFVWVIEAAVLTPTKLVPALRSAGVPAAVANAIPEVATKDQKDAKPAEIADMKAKIASVVTPAYVDKKMQNIVETTTAFLRNGTPQPTVDLSDFPAQLRASGIDVGNDLDKNFGKPIELNKDGKLDKLPAAYNKFKMLKYAGAALFVLILTAEWFIAEKGKKLQRAGRIFLHAGLWYLLYYIFLIVLPSHLLPKLKDSIKPDQSVATLIDDFAKAIQNLFGQYFLGFAVACITIAVILYIARHGRKHVQNIQDTPEAKKPAPAKPLLRVASRPAAKK